MMEFLSFERMQYLVSYPKGYCKGEKYPVIIFLHGAGTRGNDIGVLARNPFFKITERYENFPFVTVAPLCSENTWFDMFEVLKRFVGKIVDEDFSDKERIYLMGNSMGGYGTWQLAMSMPECFAAAVPICGGGMYWNAARLLYVPVWAFHGEADPTVLAEESKKMVEAINKKGGAAKLTVYPDTKHDSWTATYSNDEVFRWLLSHRRHRQEVKGEDFSDSQKYG